jgi:hypothetical protein
MLSLLVILVLTVGIMGWPWMKKLKNDSDGTGV